MSELDSVLLITTTRTRLSGFIEDSVGQTDDADDVGESDAEAKLVQVDICTHILLPHKNKLKKGCVSACISVRVCVLIHYCAAHHNHNVDVDDVVLSLN